MLSLVGDPCAINPDSRLREHARDAGLADPRLPHRPQGGKAGLSRPALAGAATGTVAAAVAIRRRAG